MHCTIDRACDTCCECKMAEEESPREVGCVFGYSIILSFRSLHQPRHCINRDAVRDSPSACPFNSYRSVSEFRRDGVTMQDLNSAGIPFTPPAAHRPATTYPPLASSSRRGSGTPESLRHRPTQKELDAAEAEAKRRKVQVGSVDDAF